MSSSAEKAAARTPRLRDLAEPTVVGLFVGNGTGSKLLQGYLDGAPDLYMIPAYPLMYLYPHWRDWEHQNAGAWTWERALDLFCEKHGSVLDTRRIPGFNGLQNLGKSQNEHLQIDEAQFRRVMLDLLEGEPVASRAFTLAVHYAYHLCRGEDIREKKVLVYHIHTPQYLELFLADFPDSRVIAMTRDPRTNFDRRVKAAYNVDEGKLTKTDAHLFRPLPNYHVLRYITEDLQFISARVPPERLCLIRHEDMGTRLEPVLKALCAWSGLKYRPEMLNITFGGKEWWGDKVYEMKPTNTFNTRVLSKAWKDKSFTELFAWEAAMFDIFNKYGYECTRYTKDTWTNRLLAAVLMLVPVESEREMIKYMFSPATLKSFWKACLAEARGELPLKTKDYGWNGTHLYKWMYIELKLWKIRPHVRLLDAALKSGKAGFAGPVYVAGQCLRYGYALATLPYWYLRRRKVQWLRLIERISGSAVIPEPLLP